MTADLSMSLLDHLVIRKVNDLDFGIFEILSCLSLNSVTNMNQELEEKQKQKQKKTVKERQKERQKEKTKGKLKERTEGKTQQSMEYDL